MIQTFVNNFDMIRESYIQELFFHFQGWQIVASLKLSENL